MSILENNKQSNQKSFRSNVKELIKSYLTSLEGQDPNNLFEILKEEVEAPMLEVLMEHTRYNQSRTARILGLSRGTLRQKLRHYFGDRYIHDRK